MKLVPIGRADPLVASNAKALRELADLADAGRLTSFIAFAAVDGEYWSEYGASKLECVAMSAMLHANCLQRIRP
jgi:hypothetical protein